MSHVTRHTVKHHRRTTFVAGRLRPQRQPRPCHGSWHIGPLIDTEKFDAEGGVWGGSGVCAACGFMIHKSQLRRLA